LGSIQIHHAYGGLHNVSLYEYNIHRLLSWAFTQIYPSGANATGPGGHTLANATVPMPRALVCICPRLYLHFRLLDFLCIKYVFLSQHIQFIVRRENNSYIAKSYIYLPVKCEEALKGTTCNSRKIIKILQKNKILFFRRLAAPSPKSLKS
jgi:hypothetical protein